MSIAVLSSLKQVFNFSPNRIELSLSQCPKRQKAYVKCLTLCHQGKISLKDMIMLGEKLMKKARLHHHFFGDHSFSAIAQYLTHYALNIPYQLGMSNPIINRRLSSDDVLKIIPLFEQRIADRLPVEYITGEAYYFGNVFHVNKHVLVPRSIMNTRFQDFLNQTTWENYRVLDLCTGSGCIGITLALMHPHIQVDLVDISPQALDVARMNIHKFKLGDRVRCIESDLFDNVKHKYDLIISNPPYVSSGEYHATPLEFKNEPKLALECGKDGLDIVHKILSQAKHYLNAQGTLIAEIGYPAANRVKKLYKKIAFKWFKYRRPNGKESLLGMEGVFLCQAKDLPVSG